jgi:hypothetical protein
MWLLPGVNDAEVVALNPTLAAGGWELRCDPRAWQIAAPVAAAAGTGFAGIAMA